MKTKESFPPLINEDRELASSDMEKAKVLNKCFASVFTDGKAPHICQDPEPLAVGERTGFHPTLTVEQARDNLMKLNVCKSMGPDDIRPKVLRERADVVAKSHFIIFEKSWLSVEIPSDWKKENIIPVFKKGKKEDPGK